MNQTSEKEIEKIEFKINRLSRYYETIVIHALIAIIVGFCGGFYLSHFIQNGLFVTFVITPILVYYSPQINKSDKYPSVPHIKPPLLLAMAIGGLNYYFFPDINDGQGFDVGMAVLLCALAVLNKKNRSSTFYLDSPSAHSFTALVMLFGATLCFAAMAYFDWSLGRAIGLGLSLASVIVLSQLAHSIVIHAYAIDQILSTLPADKRTYLENGEKRNYRYIHLNPFADSFRGYLVTNAHGAQTFLARTKKPLMGLDASHIRIGIAIKTTVLVGVQIFIMKAADYTVSIIQTGIGAG